MVTHSNSKLVRQSSLILFLSLPRAQKWEGSRVKTCTHPLSETHGQRLIYMYGMVLDGADESFNRLPKLPNGCVHGSVVAEFLRQSGLPDNVLGVVRY
jgi:hypothetical protein